MANTIASREVCYRSKRYLTAIIANRIHAMSAATGKRRLNCLSVTQSLKRDRFFRRCQFSFVMR